MLVYKYTPMFIFHQKESYRPCSIDRIKTGIEQNSNVIYYIHNKEEQYITYVLFYAQNSGHAEFVRVYYDDTKIVRAYFSAHSSDQGTWINGDKIEYIGYSPVVYVARKTHANYPKSKTIWRIFGFANDYLSFNGKLWIPRNVLPLKDDDSLSQYKYKILKGAPPGIFYRLFYPLSKLKKI